MNLTQVQHKSLRLISLCLVIAAAFAWYGASKDVLKAVVKLPKGIGGVAHDVIYATILTAISVWWSSSVAEPADIL